MPIPYTLAPDETWGLTLLVGHHVLIRAVPIESLALLGGLVEGRIPIPSFSASLPVGSFGLVRLHLTPVPIPSLDD